MAHDVRPINLGQGCRLAAHKYQHDHLLRPPDPSSSSRHIPAVSPQTDGFAKWTTLDLAEHDEEKRVDLFPRIS
jgi:hypothetical protein